MKRALAIGLAAAASFALASAAQADPSGVKTGILSCNVSSGFGFVFGSSKDMNCTFAPANGPEEHYTGTINKYGVDIGFQKGGILVWGVFAPGKLAPGALAGNYGGATASATVGVGAGANVLVGGSSSQVTLQPVSVEGSIGLNVAAGIGSLELKAAK